MLHPSVPLLAYAIVEGTMLATGLFTTDSGVPGTPSEFVTTLGPFSAAIGLSYYLLRRSDSREAVAEQIHIQREHRLEDQIAECRAALAIAKAEIERLRQENNS